MNLGWVNIALGTLPPDEKFELLSMLWRAQEGSGIENSDNASNFVVRNVSAGSLSLINALAAGVLSTGGLHAPVTQARTVIFRYPPHAVGKDFIIPGFGNSFYKDRVDPVWAPLLLHIQEKYTDTASKIQAWSDVMKTSNKNHHPNAACITAAVAEIVGWPDGMEPLLVIEPRLSVWAKMALDVQPGKVLLS